MALGWGQAQSGFSQPCTHEHPISSPLPTLFIFLSLPSSLPYIPTRPKNREMPQGSVHKILSFHATQSLSSWNMMTSKDLKRDILLKWNALTWTCLQDNYLIPSRHLELRDWHLMFRSYRPHGRHDNENEWHNQGRNGSNGSTRLARLSINLLPSIVDLRLTPREENSAKMLEIARCHELTVV